MFDEVSCRRRLWLAFGVLVALVSIVRVPESRSTAAATADIVGTLSGPTDGNVGDTFTYTVTATNRGPDQGYVLLSFAMSKGHALDLVDFAPVYPTCRQSESTDQAFVNCDPLLLPAGESTVLTINTHLTQKIETTVTGFGLPSGGVADDPDTSNNSSQLLLFSAPPPPPPTTTTTTAGPTPPPYRFVATLPHGTEGRSYNFALLDCPGGGVGCIPQTLFPSVSVVGGSLPGGMKFINGYALSGFPSSAGTYTFTLQAALPELNYLPLQQQLTLVVDPVREPSSGSGQTLILPNKTRTPGATDAAVTQATIKKTICTSGWTARVRPPAAYTNALKLKQMRQYGEKGKPTAYEEDHLIPLELGGAPRNPKNLWPEPRSESKHSDPLEPALRQRVCSGQVTLVAARRQILAYKRAHG